MKLNLFSGDPSLHKKGFINIDMYGSQYVDGDTQFLIHDLRQGLPLLDFKGQVIKDVSTSYTSHGLEHITNEQVKVLLADLYKVTKVGGITSHCIPDFPSTFKAYVEKNDLYFSEINKGWQGFPPGPHSRISNMEYSVYQGGEHVSLWDQDKALAYLAEAGFTPSVRQWDKNLDSPAGIRMKYSFYIEGVKLLSELLSHRSYLN